MPQRRGFKKRGGFKKYRKRGVANTYFKGSQFQKYANMAYKGFRIATRVAGLVNVEYKVKDLVATATPSTSGSLSLLNGLTKGDDYNNRDGRQVRWKSIQMYLRSTLHASATNTSIRVIIFIDKQASETAPTAAALLDLTTASAVDAFRNLSNRKRFVIIADKRVVINTNYPEKTTRLYKRLDMKQIFDDSDAGTVSDITTNSLYVLFLSDEATNVPSIVHNFRLRFIDN